MPLPVAPANVAPAPVASFHDNIETTAADHETRIDTLEAAGGSGDAADISVTDAGGFYTGTDVEAVLQEIGPLLGGGGIEDWTDLGNLGATETITGTDDVVVRRKGTLDQACTVTITLTANQQVSLLLAQDGTGGRAVTFAGVDTWATSDGLAPDTSTRTASQVDRFHFEDVAGTTFGYWVTEPPAAGGGGGITFTQTIYEPSADISTTSTSYVDIDATNLPAKSLTLAVGDVVELKLVATWGFSAGGNVISVDWLVDRPTSADTNTRGGKHAAAEIELATGSTDANTRTVESSFTCTEAGVHTFKPQWRVNSGTGYIRGAGTYHSPVRHRVTNLGAAS